MKTFTKIFTPIIMISTLTLGSASVPAQATNVITYSTDIDLYSNEYSASTELNNVGKIVRAAIAEYRKGNTTALARPIITNNRLPLLKINIKGQPKQYSAYQVEGSYYLANGTYNLTARAYVGKTWVKREFVPFLERIGVALYNHSYYINAHWAYKYVTYRITDKHQVPVVVSSGYKNFATRTYVNG